MELDHGGDAGVPVQKYLVVQSRDACERNTATVSHHGKQGRWLRPKADEVWASCLGTRRSTKQTEGSGGGEGARLCPDPRSAHRHKLDAR